MAHSAQLLDIFCLHLLFTSSAQKWALTATTSSNTCRSAGKKASSSVLSDTTEEVIEKPVIAKVTENTSTVKAKVNVELCNDDSIIVKGDLKQTFKCILKVIFLYHLI